MEEATKERGNVEGRPTNIKRLEKERRRSTSVNSIKKFWKRKKDEIEDDGRWAFGRSKRKVKSPIKKGEGNKAGELRDIMKEMKPEVKTGLIGVKEQGERALGKK